MHLMEVSVLRSGSPRALWCALTVHGSAGPRVPEADGTGHAPACPVQDPFFATGALLSAPHTAAAEPARADETCDTGRHLMTQLLSLVPQDPAPPRWYLLAEPEAHQRLDDLKTAIGSVLTHHACHREAWRALSPHTELTVVWSTHTGPPRSAACLPSHQLDYYPRLLNRIGQLAEEGLHAPAITRHLQQEGFTLAPGREDHISLSAVQRLLREQLRPTAPPRPHPVTPSRETLGTGEWWLQDLARELSMPAVTLYSWVRRGWVAGARRETRPPYRWIVHADPAELTCLRERRARTVLGRLHHEAVD